MSMMTVPTLQPGERSLPAELRTRRGTGFASRRLQNGMRGVTGIGDDSGDDSGDDTGGSVFVGPIDPTTVTTLPLDSTTTAGALDTLATAPDVTLAPVAVTGGTSVLPTTAQTGGDFIQAPPNYSAPAGYPTTYSGTTPPSAAPSGYQWVQAANGAALNLAKVLAISQGGTVMQLPNGQQIISGASGASNLSLSAAGLTGSISSFLPYILLIGGAFLVINMMGKR